MAPPRSPAEAKATEVLQRAREESVALGEQWDAYNVDVELLAAILFDLGVQQVPDLRVGEREYAGFLDGDAGLVVVEETHHEHRRRFSIAHEVGHYVLHYLPRTAPVGVFACTSRDMETDAVPARESAARLLHCRREVEANLFAGELLMPAPSVAAMHKVTGGQVGKLARHFNVSARAMEIRLTRLGLPFSPILR
ncbi:MAG TPA: ImmA/IrrE family metallo-endopeptidase [Symbiobacteriaceae bacterium]|nr:ImmA/IrrE family metallo-endopeptidase [Symbiobacteriaceae bacterium]